MKPRIGRPTTNPKIKSTRIRISAEEEEKLNYCSETLKVTKTDVLLIGLNKVYTELKGKE